MADAQQLLGAGNIKTDESTSDPGNFFKGPIHENFFGKTKNTQPGIRILYPSG